MKGGELEPQLDENVADEGDAEEQEFQMLDAVSAVQDELNNLEEEEAQQVLLVHKAFMKRKRPLYVRRQAAISKVPDFWLKVLLAHPLTQPWVSDGDQLALSYLEAVAVSKASAGKALVSSATALVSPAQRAPESEGDGEEGVQDRKNGKNSREECAEELDDDDDVGFRISFVFRENPFFSNAELWKEWEAPEGQQVQFSAVEWKHTEEAKELQSCLIWNLDPAAAQEETPSFFSIFCEEIDDDEVGEALRRDIIDNPLDIYMRHDFDAEAEEDEAPQAQAQAQAPEDGDYVDDDGIDGDLVYDEDGDTKDRDVDNGAHDWVDEAGD